MSLFYLTLNVCSVLEAEYSEFGFIEANYNKLKSLAVSTKGSNLPTSTYLSLTK